ncbi:IS110 family RNA-guided transposase [Tautonia plasticadhaerens]|uniref:Transposase IS116/IS110/IS902 family protein n=2 Tax=Tautonia plasticadhaerens TaxID=2527974 RepID=A0A518HFA6_9BACT|nr:IS110 family transposase [Tautonia plasticadhaerens]QDV39511.1 Transposase IS116/IS110/IS902 family protein [Tautonia plasticadhaerens]
MTTTTKKKVRFVRPNSSTSSTPRLDSGETAHVGVDVHKASHHVAVVTDLRGLVASRTPPADPESLSERPKPIGSQVARVVYEAGPTGFTLARRLRSSGLRAGVIAPSKTPTMPGPEAESDRLDRRKLAVFARKGPLQPVRVPEEREGADRRVLRLREQLARKLRAAQQQVQAFLLQHGIAEPAGLTRWTAASVDAPRRLELTPEPRLRPDVMLDERQHDRERVARAPRRLEESAGAGRHRETVATPRTAPGVGPITAMTSRVELHDPARFRDGGQVARVIGLAPQVSQGGPTRREGRRLKSGNARLRTAPVEAARRWVAGDEAAKARYRRLVATTGNGKKAIAGMARRLAILLWRLSLSGEPYRAAAWRPGPAPATPERPGSRPRPLPERPSSGAGRPRASEDLRVR